MIIDTSYFKGGKVYIPNAAGNPSVTGNVPTSEGKITSYIERYEEELLSNALGYENYEALSTAFKADPTLANPENEKWKDLVNGKTYSFEGRLVKWPGLIQKGEHLNTSLIADFVFFFYLTDNFQHYTNTGMQKEKAKNAEEQSPALKLTQVWREFIQKYQFGVVTQPVTVTTRGGSYRDFYNPQFNAQRSLYQFLRDNDNYGDYEFKVYENRNRFGI